MRGGRWWWERVGWGWVEGKREVMMVGGDGGWWWLWWWVVRKSGVVVGVEARDVVVREAASVGMPLLAGRVALQHSN